MTETADTRLRRLKMRSIRRGIKEMDLILGTYAERRLPDLDDEGLAQYDRLLSENDQDLYRWVSGQEPPPDAFAPLIADIARTAEAAARSA